MLSEPKGRVGAWTEELATERRGKAAPSGAPEASSGQNARAERLLDAGERVLVNSQTLGWGIIGLGRIAGTEIAPAITASASGALVSVVSRDQGRAEEFAREHGAADALDDYAKMLADPAVQAVYIATPNAQHPEQVIAAARAGKHVLCDKPLAVTVADAWRCIEECRAAGVGLGITFQTRFYDGMAEAAALVREGGIGRVVTAEAQIGTRGNLPEGLAHRPGAGRDGHAQQHRGPRPGHPALPDRLRGIRSGRDGRIRARVRGRHHRPGPAPLRQRHPGPAEREPGRARTRATTSPCTVPRAGYSPPTCRGPTGTAPSASSLAMASGSSRPPPETPTFASSRPSPPPSPAAATRARPARTGCAAWNSRRPSRTRSARAGSSPSPPGNEGARACRNS